MNTRPCQLCNKPVGAEGDAYCPLCSQMDNNLRFLIEAHPDSARGYLGNMTNQLADRLEKGSDRRATTYTPPKGTHTPERRSRIRRLKQLNDSPRRRRSDQG